MFSATSIKGLSEGETTVADVSPSFKLFRR